MPRVSRSFQVFAKPAGSRCNLACRYCYYLDNPHISETHAPPRMPDDLLERYIVQHIEASHSNEIRFSWHGGEPTLAGLDYYRKIITLQRRHRPPGRQIANGIQTNGTLIDDEWCRFLASENFAVGLSLDGPQPIHDRHRVSGTGEPTFGQVMRGCELLRQHGIDGDILCVVSAHNARHPTQVYRFFKQIGARYITFLPLVERDANIESGASERSVGPEAWGDFLCTIFDEWVSEDIGQVDVQIFEEATRPALGQEHGLCIFRETCGDVPVIECGGDFYSCDHFVDSEHCLGNIRERHLAELLESPEQRAFGRAKRDTLPRYCRSCDVLEMCNGECPKNRFLQTPDGEPGLNYLCEGYRRFFTHCSPFVDALAALQSVPPPGRADNQAPAKTGRNDPCPCGSGRKYKSCCLNR